MGLMNKLKLVLLPLTRVRAYLPTISNLAILLLPLSSIIPALTKQPVKIENFWWEETDRIEDFVPALLIKFSIARSCWPVLLPISLLTQLPDAGGMPQSTVRQKVLFQVWPKTIPSVDNPIITTLCLVSKEVGGATLLVRSLIICLGPFYHSWAGERSESF